MHGPMLTVLGAIGTVSAVAAVAALWLAGRKPALQPVRVRRRPLSQAPARRA